MATRLEQQKMTRLPQQIMEDAKNDLRRLARTSESQLSYLYDRWQDEKEYEDFNDYIEQMKKLLTGHSNFKFVSASKRPFQMVVAHKDLTTVNMMVRIKSRRIEWGAAVK